MRISKAYQQRVARLGVEPLETRRMLSGDPVGATASELAHADSMHLSLAEVRQQWQVSGAGQTVVIIDSGVAYDHVALGGGLGEAHRVVGGWDFTENDSDPYDDGPLGFHGTHVAGVIASDDATYPGVAPGADLVALRVFDDQGHSDFTWIEQALWWTHEHRASFKHPVTTVNLSLGGLWNDDEVPDWARLESVFAALEEVGIAIIASAGNDFQPDAPTVGLSYPAASPHVIPVASVDGAGQLSQFTQRHPRVIAAFGEEITSTVPDYLFGFDGVTDDYLAISGTSVAAPLVAGAAVLVREALMRADPQATIDQDDIVRVMRDTADMVYDPATGEAYRRLNIAAALEAVLGAHASTNPDTMTHRRTPQAPPAPLTAVYPAAVDAALAESADPPRVRTRMASAILRRTGQ